MTVGDNAFRFDPLQDELLQTALRRDEGVAQRWASICGRYSTNEITDRTVRRLLPLVEQNLGAASETIIGHEILRDACRQAEADYATRVRWMEHLLTPLTEAGIDTLVLKGFALASAYYAKPALRPMVDVDVLVRPRDLQATLEVAAVDRVGITHRTPPRPHQAAPGTRPPGSGGREARFALAPSSGVRQTWHHDVGRRRVLRPLTALQGGRGKHADTGSDRLLRPRARPRCSRGLVQTRTLGPGRHDDPRA